MSTDSSAVLMWGCKVEDFKPNCDGWILAEDYFEGLVFDVDDIVSEEVFKGLTDVVLYDCDNIYDRAYGVEIAEVDWGCVEVKDLEVKIEAAKKIWSQYTDQEGCLMLSSNYF